MKNLIVIASFFFNLTESLGCSCLPIAVKDNYEQSTLVFRGEVIAVDTLSKFDDDLPKGAFRELHLGIIKVDKIYKGKALSDTIRVITGSGRGDCGYEFLPRVKCIVYAVERDFSIIDSTILPSLDVIVSNRRFLYTDDCDRTTSEVTEEDKLLKQFLGHRKTVRNPSKQ